MLNKQQREELNKLSLEVFGSASRWKKILDRGHTELVTEEVTETLPKEDGTPGEEQKVKRPVKVANGANKYTMKYYTEETILSYMLEQKANVDKIKESIRKHQEEQKTKLEEEEKIKQVHEQLAGSAKV